MDFNEEELKLEFIEAEESNIELASSATKCEVCKIGKVVKVGRQTPLVLYTRVGTKKGFHVEMRCNNRSLPCRVGHYFGYLKNGAVKVIDTDVLRKEFLITSNQTAFSIDYLWDITLQILFSHATFEGLGNIFNNLHFTNLPYDMLQKRETIFSKRIAEAFYLYSYIELGQRYDISMTIPTTLDEAILENKSLLQDAFRTNWTINHRCDTAGCGSIITMDGGCKPHRKLCGAKLAGVRQFQSSGLSVVTGCTSIPGPKSKFCHEHQSSESPALLSDQVSNSTRTRLRDHRTTTAESKEAPQDNIYVIESILEVDTKDDETFFKVKWLNFPPSESTWENQNSIPKFIQLYYKDANNFGKRLPNPNLKRVKKAGSAIYHLLSWEGKTDAGQWVNEDFFKLLGEDGEIVSSLEDENSCNTRKSRDKGGQIIFREFPTFFMSVDKIQIFFYLFLAKSILFNFFHVCFIKSNMFHYTSEMRDILYY